MEQGVSPCFVQKTPDRRLARSLGLWFWNASGRQHQYDSPSLQSPFSTRLWHIWGQTVDCAETLRDATPAVEL